MAAVKVPMRRVWILASGRAEAEQVARDGGLHPTQWRTLTDNNIRGASQAEVWKTPCWWHGLNGVQIARMNAVLLIVEQHGGNVILKPCPVSRAIRM